MKLLLALVTLVAHLPASATSYPDPPKDTGIEIKVTSLQRHPENPEYTVIAITIVNTANNDYFIRTTKVKEWSKLYSEANPNQISYVVVPLYDYPRYREGGKWELLGGDPVPLAGDSWKEFPAGEKVTLSIPIGPDFIANPTSGTLAFTFAKQDRTGSKSHFHLLRNSNLTMPNKAPQGKREDAAR